jgi:xanthine dehydrogenase accessory factor
MSLWSTIEQYVASHSAAALVTLAETRGSSPREVGARMVVRPDGGFVGTIGGGTLEWAALAEAQALLARRGGNSVRRLTKALGPDLGQCCGGQVTLIIERFDGLDQPTIAGLAAAERIAPLTTIATPDRAGRLARRLLAAGDLDGPPPRDKYHRLPDGRIVERFADVTTPLYLFGAGHVGRALALALAPLPFVVTWVDPRPTAFPPQVPANAVCVIDADPVRLLGRAPDDALVAVMTHSHALDLDLVIAALRSQRFRFVGLIGSATKRARFVSAMQKIGIAPRAIERLQCPIGLVDIRDKAPAVIAASVAAQMLLVRDAAQARVEIPAAIADNAPRDTGHG